VSSVKATAASSPRESVVASSSEIGPSKVPPSNPDLPRETISSSHSISRGSSSVGANSRSKTSVEPTRASVNPSFNAYTTTTSHTRSTVTVFVTIPWSETESFAVSSGKFSCQLVHISNIGALSSFLPGRATVSYTLR
jgi:hypothetical protein